MVETSRQGRPGRVPAALLRRSAGVGCGGGPLLRPSPLWKPPPASMVGCPGSARCRRRLRRGPPPAPGRPLPSWKPWVRRHVPRTRRHRCDHGGHPRRRARPWVGGPLGLQPSTSSVPRCPRRLRARLRPRGTGRARPPRGTPKSHRRPASVGPASGRCPAPAPLRGATRTIVPRGALTQGRRPGSAPCADCAGSVRCATPRRERTDRRSMPMPQPRPASDIGRFHPVPPPAPHARRGAESTAS